jgi:hypothetical protein
MCRTTAYNYFFVIRFSLNLRRRNSAHIYRLRYFFFLFRVTRLQSSLYATAWWIVRPTPNGLLLPSFRYFSHLIIASDIATQVNSQFLRPDLHRLDIQHYRLQPSLHGHYPLPRYYGLIRLPRRTDTRLCIPLCLLGFPCPEGSPKFRDWPFSTRRPFKPRRALWLLLPVPSSQIAGFIVMRQLTTLIWK